MTALAWQLFTRFKNELKQFIRRPANLILVLFLGAMMVLTLTHSEMPLPGDTRPLAELCAIVTALLVVVYTLGAYQGLGRGTSLFTMADVQLLFPSPLSPRQLLYFGLVQKLGNSLLVGFFLLFQYGWVHEAYGVGIGALLLVMALYGVTIFMGQLTAMALYTACSGHPERKRAITFGFFAVIILFAALGLVAALQTGQSGLNAVVAGLQTPALAFYPVGGMLGAVFQGVMLGDVSGALCGLGFTFFILAILTFLLGRADSGYYESALEVASRSHQAITAAKEGRVQEAAPENVKTGRTGLRGGWGPSAIYYKHRLESRRGRKFLINTQSLIFVVIILAFSFFMRKEGILPAFIFATYMQLFTTAMGRWARELQMPWVYRMPGSSMRKLCWCLAESLEGMALEAVLVMVPMGLMMNLDAPAILMGVMARFALSLLFVGGNLLGDRLFGALRAKALILIFFILEMLILLIPGIALSVYLNLSHHILLSPDFTTFLALTATSALLSPFTLFLARSILNNVEMNG